MEQMGDSTAGEFQQLSVLVEQELAELQLESLQVQLEQQA